MSFASHTTKMALVVLRNMRSSSDLASDVQWRLTELHLYSVQMCHFLPMYSSRFRTLHQIEQKLRKLGNLKLWRRVLNSADIQGRVQELKDIFSHAYTKFNVSTLLLLFLTENSTYSALLTAGRLKAMSQNYNSCTI